MTRLFLRFYLGVVVIVAIAAVVQLYVLFNSSRSQNTEVFKEMNFGGLRLAANLLAQTKNEDRRATLLSIKNSFDFPVEELNATDKRNWASLIEGEPQFIDAEHIVLRVDQDQVLLFGPIPAYFGPQPTDVFIGMGLILLLTALAIAVLLRPVVNQLRAVERTATAISEGDLSARIEGGSYRASVPIASAFNAMADRTQSLLKSQRELLQAVSHELRTPLARIRFATELVATAENVDQRATRLAAIDKATEELDALVGELLSYVRLDSASNNAELENVKLDELFAEVIERHAPLYPEINFSVELANQLNVEASRVGLARAVGNLVGNAGRYANSKVVVSATNSENGVMIQVDDDGPGIPAEDRERVLEPFVRLENARNGHGLGGTGLGLALVKRIALRHSGDVKVTTNQNGGTRVQIRLPHAQVHN